MHAQCSIRRLQAGSLAGAEVPDAGGPERLADVANAIDNEDAEALRQHSHKLKGSVGEIGAKSLHKLLQSLEHPDAEQDNRAVFSQVVKDSETLRQTLTQYIAA